MFLEDGTLVICTRMTFKNGGEYQIPPRNYVELSDEEHDALLNTIRDGSFDQQLAAWNELCAAISGEFIAMNNKNHERIQADNAAYAAERAALME